MANSWRKWIQKDRGTKLIGGFLACGCGIFFLVLRLTQDTIHSKNDLEFIKGQLGNYSFVNGTRGFRSYDFRLLHDPILYRIDADFLNFFDEDSFRKLNYGDTLTIALFKDTYNQIINYQFRSLPSYVLVYSIANNTTTFLDCDKAIQKHNSLLPFYAAAGFFLAGLTMMYLLYKTRQNKIIN